MGVLPVVLYFVRGNSQLQMDEVTEQSFLMLRFYGFFIVTSDKIFNRQKAGRN